MNTPQVLYIAAVLLGAIAASLYSNALWPGLLVIAVALLAAAIIAYLEGPTKC